MKPVFVAGAALFAVSACQSLTQSQPPAEENSPAVTDSETMNRQAFLLPTGENDPYMWLEAVEGEAALDWVRAQNERTLDDLRSDALYEPFYNDALDALTSDERIPYGTIRDGMVYNFWQDETHVRGLWRRTPLESYASESPEWETVLDIDQLAEAEGRNWVYKGASCHKVKAAGSWKCLVALSDGGKDAVIRREFDLATKAFVEGGFETPEAKHGTAWADSDTLLVATDWGEGTLTASGYPYIVKRWKRGTPLNEATEVLRGKASDVGVWPMVIETGDGTRLQGAVVSDTFFTQSYYWFPEGELEPVQWPLPPKSSPEGIFEGEFLVSLRQDWTPEGQDRTFRSGDVAAFDLDAFLETRALPPVNLVFRPSETQAVNGVAIAKGAALLSIDDNVVGKVLALEPAGDGWTTREIALPGKGQTGIAFADRDVETVFLNYEGFLTPDSLLRYEPSTGEITTLKSLPAKFNAEGLTVDQHFAVSSDGTKIPYFIVHRADMPLDGTTPTLLYGYGGFQVSMNPSYSAVRGRLWLEQGGAYVLANIRGGGEFGPGWHQAGLKQKRQIIYDDFIAVGEDLIDRGVTTTDHLGIQGGSNGGLLMGVMLTQRPDLWDAVVIQVPLLDMLRYHKLLAGASWVDEYGSPDIADERAFLETISPYHNFDPDADYPVPFFVTSTKDDRVHPGHARKMAKLFELAGKPFFYYENIDGGHSAAANQKEAARRSALEHVYLNRRLFPKAGR